MVPIPDGTWHEEMIDELYSSLLGKNYNIHDDDDNNDNEKIENSLSELKIFG